MVDNGMNGFSPSGDDRTRHGRFVKWVLFAAFVSAVAGFGLPHSGPRDVGTWLFIGAFTLCGYALIETLLYEARWGP